MRQPTRTRTIIGAGIANRTIVTITGTATAIAIGIAIIATTGGIPAGIARGRQTTASANRAWKASRPDKACLA